MLSNIPSIEVHIATSSSTLDLAHQNPWSIAITLSLHHTNPITFHNQDAVLFDGRLLYTGGLTFTNTLTHLPAPRNSIDICTFDGDDYHLSETNKENFTTLYPGQQHTVSATLQPSITTPFVHVTPEMTVEAVREKQASSKKTWKWRHVEGLEDGQSYELGLSREARLNQWMEGSREEILAIEGGNASKRLRKDVVDFRVVETATVNLKRPDRDGSLNWP